MSCIRRGHACALILLLTAHAPAQVDASLSWPRPFIATITLLAVQQERPGPAVSPFGREVERDGGIDWRTQKYACSCLSSPFFPPRQGIHTGGADRGSPSPPDYLPCSTPPPSVGHSSFPAARLRRLPRVSAGAAGHLGVSPVLELRGGGAKKVKGPAPDVKSVLAVGSVCAAVLCPPQAQRKQQVEGGQKAKSGTR